MSLDAWFVTVAVIVCGIANGLSMVAAVAVWRRNQRAIDWLSGPLENGHGR